MTYFEKLNEREQKRMKVIRFLFGPLARLILKFIDRPKKPIKWTPKRRDRILRKAIHTVLRKELREHNEIAISRTFDSYAGQTIYDDRIFINKITNRVPKKYYKKAKWELEDSILMILTTYKFPHIKTKFYTEHQMAELYPSHYRYYDGVVISATE